LSYAEKKSYPNTFLARRQQEPHKKRPLRNPPLMTDGLFFIKTYQKKTKSIQGNKQQK
jgi:hypothetical protein